MLSKSKLPKIETKNIPTASEARSIYKICSSYLDYLIEKGVVPLAERYDYLVERQGEVLEALFKQLYETEMYKGIRISTLNAFWHFCEFVIHEDPIRGKKVWNPFVKNLFSDIEMHRYCCLMASRGIGKSYLAHGLYILFKGFLYKYTDFLLITNIPSQYEENIRTLKRLIESNEMLLQKKKEDCVWTQSKVEYNGGMIIAQSVGTPPRGKHPQYIFPDDILRDDNKISEEELDNFVKAQLLPCAQRWKSRIAFTGCVNPNTLIITKKGFEPIKNYFDEVKENEVKDCDLNVYGLNGFHKARKLFNNGVVKTKIITTKRNYQLESSLEHPVLILDNGIIKWKKVSDLKEGDFIAIQRNQDIFGNVNKQIKSFLDNYFNSKIRNGCTLFNNFDDLFYFMGLYIAEGCSEKSGRITISCGDKYVHKFLQNSFDNVERRDSIHSRFSNKLIYDFLKYFNMPLTLKAKQKYIPYQILLSSKSNQINFLRGLFDGDGSSTFVKKGVHVTLASSSEFLIRQVHIMLLNFGIISTIKRTITKPTKKVSKECVLYLLRITGNDAVSYLKKIGFRIKRKQKEASYSLNKKDIIPGIQQNVFSIIKKLDSKLLKKYMYQIKNSKAEVTYRKLKEIILECNKQKIDCHNLEKLMIGGYYWDRIFSVKDSYSKTLDFIIPETHSFFTNGFVSHNTPMHITDIYHDLMNKEKDFKGQIITDGHLSHCGFYSKTYPIITDWDKKEIFLPDLFTWKELVTNVNSIKNIQGDDKFSREYLLVCTDKSTSLFSQELLTRAQDDSIEVTYKDDHDGNYITGVDVATSGEASADFSAFVTIELVETKKGLKKYLRHMVYEKGMPITGDMTKEGEIIDIGQVETIDDIYHRFNTGLVVVEKNNVGVAHIQELQKRNVNVQEFVTDRHKKENMLRYLVSEMKQGNLIFPKDTLEIKALKQELLNFGVKRTRSGKERMEALHGHDDGVMALAIANYASQSYGGLAYAICQD